VAASSYPQPSVGTGALGTCQPLNGSACFGARQTTPLHEPKVKGEVAGNGWRLNVRRRQLTDSKEHRCTVALILRVA
jgi:hypothetical protein